MLDERYVDGVIVCGFRQEDEPLQEALSHFKAVVLINRQLEGESLPAVLVDDKLGGYLVTRHLLDEGHTAVGFLAGPANSFSGAGRLQGYKQALAEAGIKPEKGWVKHCTPTYIHGQEAARQLLESTSRIIGHILLQRSGRFRRLKRMRGVGMPRPCRYRNRRI